MKIKTGRINVNLSKRKNRKGEVVYFARYQDGATKPQISLTGMNKQDAQAFVNELELKLNRPEVVAARKAGLTYEEHIKEQQRKESLKRAVIVDYLGQYLIGVERNNPKNTFKNYCIAFRCFLKFVQSRKLVYLDEVNLLHLEAYKTELAKNYKPSSIATKLYSMAGVFSQAFKVGLIEKNPFDVLSKIKIPQNEIIIFKPQEIADLFKTVYEDDFSYYVFLKVALDSAARLNELLSIVRKRDFYFEVDPDGTEYGLMSITNHHIRTKNSKNRLTPIRPDTVKLLKGLDILKLCEIAGHSSIEISRKYYLKTDMKAIAKGIARLSDSTSNPDQNNI